jgi:hypothetical protein
MDGITYGRVTAIFFAIVFSIASTFTMANGAIIYSADFEDQKIDGNGLNPEALCCSHSSIIVSNPVRSGKYAAKFTLNSDDKGTIFRSWKDPALRAELRWYNTGPKVGTERWYGFSTYVDPTWHDNTSDPNGTIVLQLHGPSDPGEIAHSPQFAIMITRDNRWRSWTLHDANAISTSSSFKKITRDHGPVTKGVWVNWVIHAKWHYNDSGLLEIWKDGVKVTTYNGPNTFNDQTQLTVAFGVYKSWYSREQPNPRDTLIIYHDQIKVGDHTSSYDEVAPVGSGSNPPAALAAPTSLRAGIQ